MHVNIPYYDEKKQMLIVEAISDLQLNLGYDSKANYYAIIRGCFRPTTKEFYDILRSLLSTMTTLGISSTTLDETIKLLQPIVEKYKEEFDNVIVWLQKRHGFSVAEIPFAANNGLEALEVF